MHKQFLLLTALVVALPAYASTVNPTVPSGPRETAIFSDEERKLAFPSAEGYGRFADPDIGPGQTFQVMKVTNLNDAGAGSFRACWMATGPRVCIFTVSGTITLLSDMLARDLQSDVYVAGQTSPGGIQIRVSPGNIGGPLRATRQSDLVLRFLKLRPSLDHTKSSAVGGVVLGGNFVTEPFNSHDIMLDHLSEQWATDEGIAVLRSTRVTLQWSLQSEPIACGPCRVDDKVNHDYGAFFVENGTASFYKNLFMSGVMRNPNIGGDLDLVNNVGYNYGKYAAQFYVNTKVSVRANVVGNWFARGPRPELMPETKQKPHCLFAANETVPAAGLGHEFYLSGNICAHDLTGTDQLRILYQNPVRGPLQTPDGDPNVVFSTPRNGGINLTHVDTAEQALRDVMAFAGARADMFKPVSRLDSVDARAIGQLQNCDNRTYTPQPISPLTFTPAYPDLTVGTTWSWANKDKDNDGMHDDWERQFVGNLTALFPNGDYDSDGWSDIEEFLNYVAGEHRPRVGVGPVPPANCGYPAQ